MTHNADATPRRWKALIHAFLSPLDENHHDNDTLLDDAMKQHI
jgi:hypothetical protein